MVATKATAKKTKATKTTKTTKTTKKSEKCEITPTLGTVIMLYTKQSTHWFGITEPEIVSISDTKFVRGKQVTGKEGHRMEGKMTLVPLENVASIIEFESEEDLWNEPQPKNLPLPIDESRQSAVLTSHEQLAPIKKHLPHTPKGFKSHFGSKFKKHASRYSDHSEF